MKKFKPGILLTSIVTILAFMSVLYISACNNKPPALSPTTCENVVCLNTGYCNNGTCQCPRGYGGTYCNIVWNSYYTGSWTVFDSVIGSNNADSVGNKRYYSITIDTGHTATSMFISNLRGDGNWVGLSNVPATIDTIYNYFKINSIAQESNGNNNVTGGYGNLLLKKVGKDTITGVYYMDYLNAQFFREQDTIHFIMSK